MRQLAPAVVACCALALSGVSEARATQGLGPDDVHLDATSDESGFVVSPAFVDLRLALSPEDGDVVVWISPSGRVSASGSPSGRAVGSCLRSELVAEAEPSVYTCPVQTSLLQAGTTYRWWIVSHDGDNEPVIAGPFSFTLGTRISEGVSDVTAAAAARLVTRARFTGARSIKHAPLTAAVARTFRRIRAPKTLAVACWTDRDFTSVLGAAGIAERSRRMIVLGVWLQRYPRWLQLSGEACRTVERLRARRVATGNDAFGLVIALHEAAHAYGIVSEAQADCYAVQLVPTAARALGLGKARSVYLGQLAVRYTRATAPPGYWSSARCRDDGAWDLPRLGTRLDP